MTVNCWLTAGPTLTIMGESTGDKRREEKKKRVNERFFISNVTPAAESVSHDLATNESRKRKKEKKNVSVDDLHLMSMGMVMRLEVPIVFLASHE